MPSPAEVEARTSAAFTARFGCRPTALGCAPGRVELLGNHTDYNGGLVLAAAIDRFTVVAGRAREGRTARFRSVTFRADETFDLDAIAPSEAGTWGRYIRGVIWAWQEARGVRKRGG